MRSLGVIVALALGILSDSFPSAAQPPAKARRVGVLFVGPPGSVLALQEVFSQGLRELGYVEGRNIALTYRYAEGKYDRLPELAGELVRLKVEVIFAPSAPAALAAKNATKTTPIVFAAVPDPVLAGLVSGLARPGGNLTGLTHISVELVAKQLQLLNEATPGLSRVAVLTNPASVAPASVLREAESAARVLKVRLQVLEVRDPKEFEGTFSAMTRDRLGGLIVLTDPVFFANRGRLAELATKSRLPAMFPQREYVEAGGLMAYGADLPSLFRRAASFVDKILKGANPAQLPVEQPAQFDLAINLKTARSLGLNLPQTVLIRADKLIE